jgi:CHASE3 domain sensor protein
MTLRLRIIAGFAVLLVPIVLIALVAFAVLGRLGGAVDAVLSENERSLRAVAEMDVALERLDSAALFALLGRRDEATTIADAARPRFRSAFAAAAGNLTIQGEDDLVAEVASAFAAYEQAFDALTASEADAARTVYAESLVPAFERVRGGLEALRSANREAAITAAEEAGSMAQTARWGIGLGALLAVLLGIWAALKLSRQIANAHEDR